MVTETKPEATPEVITQEPAAPVEETAAPSPTGDSPTESTTVAADATLDQAAALDAEISAALAEAKGKAGDETETRDTSEPAVDQREVAAAINEFRNRHSGRQSSIDALRAELLDAGVGEALATRFVKEAKDRLNDHHRDSLEFAGFESYELAKQESHASFGQAIEEALTPAMQKEMAARAAAYRKEHDGPMLYSDAMKAVVEIAGKDAVVQAHDRIFEAGYRAALLARQKQGDASASSDTPQGSAGEGGAHGLSGLEAKIARSETLSSKEWAEYDRLRAQV